MFVSNDWLDPEKKTNILHTNCQKPFWTLKNCFLTFFMFGQTKKVGEKVSFTGKVAFFTKFCVFNNLPGVK